MATTIPSKTTIRSHHTGCEDQTTAQSNSASHFKKIVKHSITAYASSNNYLPVTSGKTAPLIANGGAGNKARQLLPAHNIPLAAPAKNSLAYPVLIT